MNDLATTKPQKCGFKLSVVVGSAKIVKELTSNIIRITRSIKDHFATTGSSNIKRLQNDVKESKNCSIC